ncbi:MAG: oxidoreductase [Candidatus Micrarchaeota archaeon]|nr:oxidoreductase [Candidatus Micrarchaeota archaeon]
MAQLVLKVVNTWMETPTIQVISLNLAGEKFTFKPGQYALVELKIKQVVAGGSVGADAGGPWDDHAFSIACAPNTEYLEFATRKSDSDYKKAFVALVKGDEVKVSGPLGNFTLDPIAKSVCFLSGGIGITPIRSMVQFATQQKLNMPITLLFGNRNPSEIPFKAELDGLQKQNPNLKVVHVVSEGDAKWTGAVGRIDAELIKNHSRIDTDTYYICGPPGMVDSLTNTLKTLNVAEERIKIEYFTGYK